MGQFSNNAFQYAFLNIYAKRHNLAIEFPMWEGVTLFKNRTLQGNSNMRIKDDDKVVMDSFTETNSKVFKNVTFRGFFQYHTSAYAQDKECFRSLFQLKDEYEDFLKGELNKLRRGSKTLIAIHLRRGDFVDGGLPISPTKAYVEWLDQNWNKLDSPVLYIASDSIDTVKDDFKKYSPKDARDFAVFNPRPPYLDSYMLMNADILMVSSVSSFSFFSAMMNETASSPHFLRPDFDYQANEPLDHLKTFDPWDSDFR